MIAAAIPSDTARTGDLPDSRFRNRDEWEI